MSAGSDPGFLHGTLQQCGPALCTHTHTNTTRYSTIKNEIKHSQSSAALTDCVLSTRLHPDRKAFSFYCTPQYRNLPRGGSGDLIIVVLSQDLEQLVEEHWQEADDHRDPLHAQKTLEKDERGKQGGGRGGAERARKREEQGGGRGEEKKHIKRKAAGRM